MLTRRKIIWEWMALPKDKAQIRRIHAEDRQCLLLQRNNVRRRVRLIRPLGEGIGSLPSSRPMRNSAELYRAPPTHMRVCDDVFGRTDAVPSKEYVQCYGRP
jgi:hypothetical protein